MNSACTFILPRLGIPLLATSLLVAVAPLAPAQQPPKNFVEYEAPKAIAAIAFVDGQEQPRSLADFRGKVVLLNIWATWCGPCRREMPSLDRLQGMLGGADFEVVALSIDRAGIEVVRKFYADVGIRNLAIYIDSSGRATRELSTIGVPATLLIDREGREIGRLVGPAEWDEPEIVQFLKRVVLQKAGAVLPMFRSERANKGIAPTLATEFDTQGASWSARQSLNMGGTT
ncbi:MAG: redoxin family protein [Rhizobiales bacterium]|nr:redoxin family protein [Hyphomicrobiales bacterium]